MDIGSVGTGVARRPGKYPSPSHRIRPVLAYAGIFHRDPTPVSDGALSAVDVRKPLARLRRSPPGSSPMYPTSGERVSHRPHRGLALGADGSIATQAMKSEAEGGRESATPILSAPPLGHRKLAPRSGKGQTSRIGVEPDSGNSRLHSRISSSATPHSAWCATQP